MTLTTQFLTMTVMIIGGIYLGMALETFRRFELFWKKNNFFHYVMEITFWLLQTLILFYLLFTINNGEIRFYIFLAVLCGFAAYQSLFASYYRRLLEHIITFLLTIYHFIYQLIKVLIVTPIKWIIQLLIATLLLSIRILYTVLRLVFRIVYFPLRLVGKAFLFIIPKNAQKYLLSLAGIYSRIENNIVRRWNEYWDKGGS